MRPYRLLVALVVLGAGLATLVGCPKPTPPAPAPVTPVAPPKTAAQPPKAPSPAGEVSGQLTVLVPCGLNGPYGELETLFTKQHSGVTFGPPVLKNITELEEMATKGTEADVLLSPGDREVLAVEKAGQTMLGSRIGVALSSLTLLVPAQGAKVKGWEDLGKEPLPIVGIADPKTNSCGYYAVEALKKAGFYDKLQKAKRIVEAPQPSDLGVWIAGKKVDVAINYESCVHEAPKGAAPAEPKASPKKAKAAGPVPAGLYHPFYLTAVVLKGANNPAAAAAFVQFLVTPEAGAIWEKWSFGKAEAAVPVAPPTAK